MTEIVVPADLLKKIDALPDSPYKEWGDLEKEALKRAYQDNKDLKETVKLINKEFGNNRTYGGAQRLIERMGWGREE